MSDLSKKNCTVCLNAKQCRYINPYNGFYCPGMEIYIDNKKPRKEPLASDLIGEAYNEFVDRDYKDVLSRMRQDKEDDPKRRRDEHIKMHNRIIKMPDDRYSDLRGKAIAALLFFGVDPNKAARILKIHPDTVYEFARSRGRISAGER